MPNWVTNRVVAKDPKVLIEKLVNKEGEVDFNILIPMSEDLNIPSSTYSYEGNTPFTVSEVHNDKQRKQQHATHLLDMIYDEGLTQQEFTLIAMQDESIVKAISTVLELSPFVQSNASTLNEALDTFIKGYYNNRKYGYVDWYNWSIANWGTKWNASSCVVSNTFVEFDTAWAMPEDIFKELARYTDIRVLYADEDIGINCGLVEYCYNKEHDVVEEIELMGESHDLAYYAKGYDYMPVYDEDSWEELPETDPKYIAVNKGFQETVNLIESFMSYYDKSAV